MSRNGNCLDNAPMESFFGSLKTELVHRTRFATRRDARAALFEHIEIFDNRQRRHSSFGYQTPEQARMDITVAKAEFSHANRSNNGVKRNRLHRSTSLWSGFREQRQVTLFFVMQSETNFEPRSSDRGVSAPPQALQHHQVANQSRTTIQDDNAVSVRF